MRGGWFEAVGITVLIAWALAVPDTGLATAEDPGPAASRVLLNLTVTGELFAPAGADAEPVRHPIRLEAGFDFEERPEPAAGTGGVARRYAAAAASIEAAGSRLRRVLAVDAREVLIAREGTAALPYLADGFLSREEAELLDGPFDPSLVDDLRPQEDQRPGASWSVAGDLVAGLAAIDTVESGGIDVSLEGVAEGVARLRLAGTVTGGIDGAPTRLEIRGTASVAARPGEREGTWRLDGRVTTLEVTIRERREAGWVAPGLDVEASLSMERLPIGGEASARSAATPAEDGLAPIAADRPRGRGRPGVVWHRHPGGRYSLVLDARWRLVEDGPEGLVMRFVDRGALVAQGSILPLPRISPDAPPREDVVRSDVRRSLADQFGQIAESEAVTRDDGTRLVRVVADGAAEGRPFRWIHHVLTDASGHQVAVTCMLEPAMAERFAAADRVLVAGLVVGPDAPPRAATGLGPNRR